MQAGGRVHFRAGFDSAFSFKSRSKEWKNKNGGKSGNQSPKDDGPAEALSGRKGRKEKDREPASHNQHRGHNRFPHAFS